MGSHEFRGEGAGDVRVTVLCAGSLIRPFEEVKAVFEAEHPGTAVILEPGGSVEIIRRVIGGGKVADVVASADYALIPRMMMPEHADWYLTFAKNRMVLAYTDESRHADEITADNWYEILGRAGVRWGFSDPNLDPCGYRALMVIELACSHYRNDRIFEDLVGAHSAIAVTGERGTSTVHASDSRSDDTTLFIRPKADELVGMLLAGDLDYAWEYQSVAVQNDLLFIELPGEIDLSAMEFSERYATVQVETTRDGNAVLYAGAPIIYGVTVPGTAVHRDSGLRFIDMLVGAIGQEILECGGQPPITPAGGYGNVPARFESL